MPTYLYCLLIPAADPDPAPLIARGIGGAAVRVLPAGALEAWVSTIPTASPAATVEAGRQHHAGGTGPPATGRTPLPGRVRPIWPSGGARGGAGGGGSGRPRALSWGLAGV